MKFSASLGWIISTVCLTIIVLSLLDLDLDIFDSKEGIKIDRKLVEQVKSTEDGDSQLPTEIQLSLEASDRFVDRITLNPTLETNEIIEIVGQIKSELRQKENYSFEEANQMMTMIGSGHVSSLALQRYKQELRKAFDVRRENEVDLFTEESEAWLTEASQFSIKPSTDQKGDELLDSAKDLLARYQKLHINDRSWIEKIEAAKKQINTAQFEKEVDALYSKAKAFVTESDYTEEECSALINEAVALNTRSRSLFLQNDKPGNMLSATKTSLEALRTYHNKMSLEYHKEAMQTIDNRNLISIEYPLLPNTLLQELTKAATEAIGEESEVVIRERWIASVESLISRVFALSEADTHSKETLDELLKLESSVKESRPRVSGAHYDVLQKKLSGAEKALEAWAQYNALIEKGFAEEAVKSLRNLEPNSYDYPFITRERFEELKQVKSLVGEESTFKTLDQVADILKTVDQPDEATIATVIETITELTVVSDDTTSRRQIVELLESLKAAIRQSNRNLSAAAATDLIKDFPTIRNSSASRELKRVLELVLLDLASQHFNTGGNHPAKSDEEAYDYVLRSVSQSPEKIDITSVNQRYEGLKLLSQISDIYDREIPGWIRNEITVCQYFRIADRSQSAGDWAAALRNYRYILGKDETRLAIDEEIKNRISYIKSVAPNLLTEDYDSLMREVVTLRNSTNFLNTRIRNLESTLSTLEKRLKLPVR